MRTAFAFFGAVLFAASTAYAQPARGDVQNGQRLFNACAACHSLAPGRNLTGPSLAGIFGRKAGTLAGFDRYSPALKASGLTWDAKTLDTWLGNPEKFIPGTSMTFPGMEDRKARSDVIAFLQAAGTGRASANGGMMGGGMMGGGMKDLKKLGPAQLVRAIRLCRDSYFVTKADGKTAAFWEPNLRFETDSGNLGPVKGRPVIMPSGMMGDRAAIIFAAPEEIGSFVKQQC